MKKILTAVFALAFALTFMPTSVLAQPTDKPENKGTTGRLDMPKAREQGEPRSGEARARVEERKQEIMKKVETKRLQVKKDVCERKKQNLTTSIPKLSEGANSVKRSMDNIYEKVLNFYENSQLTVDKYSELVGNAEIAKMNAEASLATIEEQSFTIDCNSPDIAQKLEGYKLAVKGARESLMSYKKALVELISSMRAAASFENKGSGSDVNQSQAGQ